MKYTLLLLSLFISFCQTDKAPKQAVKPTKAETILAKAIATCGGKKYDTANYQFVFREKTYTFDNSKNAYRYTAKSNTDGQAILDVLENDVFTRIINGKKVSLSEKDEFKYREAINSVIYFATLPHKLQDPAVNLSYIGDTTIKGKQYEILGVTFDQEGGGVDYEDQFHYWINSTTNTIDYLAYNYKVNNGGVRFRSAYNTRNVAGILFQDYVNYKAPVGTPLSVLPTLLEKSELKKLSLIETEAVIHLDHGATIKKLGQHYQKYQDFASLNQVLTILDLYADTATVTSLLGAPIDMGFDYRYLVDSVSENGCAVGAVFHISELGKIDQQWAGEICE